MCWLLLGAHCRFSHHGLEVLTSSCVWHASFGIGMVLAASTPYVLGVVECFLHPGLWRGFVRWWPSPGFLLVFRFAIGYTLLCSLGAVGAWRGAWTGLGALGGGVGPAGVGGSVVFFGWAGGVRVLVLPGSSSLYRMSFGCRSVTWLH